MDLQLRVASWDHHSVGEDTKNFDNFPKPKIITLETTDAHNSSIDTQHVPVSVCVLESCAVGSSGLVHVLACCVGVRVLWPPTGEVVEHQPRHGGEGRGISARR